MSYSFLEHELARDYFAEADYWLRSGYHIQSKHPKQKYHFDFLEENKKSLKLFYLDFYGVELSYGNEEVQMKYYYINFYDDQNDRFSRGKISIFKNNEYLSPEYVIVGLFLWYLNNADYAGSIIEVQKMLQNDYDEFKVGFYRLFAKVTNKKKLFEDEQVVNNAIEKALKKFGEIGWLYFINDNEFEIMPSFDRLTYQLYADEINNFDKLFNAVDDEQNT